MTLAVDRRPERLIRWGRLRAALENARAQLAAAAEHSGLLSADDELWLKDLGGQLQQIEQNAQREEDRTLREASQDGAP